MQTDKQNRLTQSLPSTTTVRRVVNCYAILDQLMTACGVTDYTDGMYEQDPNRPYAHAQNRQAEVLLDRAGVRSGAKLLDIGCGNGRLLRTAKSRGAAATGLTISPTQVKTGKAQNLDVRLLNYKHVGASLDGQFDAVIANGSLEHFAQPEEAMVGDDSLVYRGLFETAHRVLNKTSNGRFVTTAIHFRERPNPRDLIRSESDFKKGSKEFHWARLHRSFGGWYPVPGQLMKCADGLFELIHEEDGTEDYLRTSDEWVKGARKTLRSPKLLLYGLRFAPLFMKHFQQLLELHRCVLGSESWNWQFRGEPSPAILLRHTWKRL